METSVLSLPVMEGFPYDISADGAVLVPVNVTAVLASLPERQRRKYEHLLAAAHWIDITYEMQRSEHNARVRNLLHLAETHVVSDKDRAVIRAYFDRFEAAMGLYNQINNYKKIEAPEGLEGAIDRAMQAVPAQISDSELIQMMSGRTHSLPVEWDSLRSLVLDPTYMPVQPEGGGVVMNHSDMSSEAFENHMQAAYKAEDEALSRGQRLGSKGKFIRPGTVLILEGTKDTNYVIREVPYAEVFKYPLTRAEAELVKAQEFADGPEKLYLDETIAALWGQDYPIGREVMSLQFPYDLGPVEQGYTFNVNPRLDFAHFKSVMLGTILTPDPEDQRAITEFSKLTPKVLQYLQEQFKPEAAKHLPDSIDTSVHVHSGNVLSVAGAFKAVAYTAQVLPNRDTVRNGMATKVNCWNNSSMAGTALQLELAKVFLPQDVVQKYAGLYADCSREDLMRRWNHIAMLGLVWAHELYGHPTTKEIRSTALEEPKATAVAVAYTGKLVEQGLMSKLEHETFLECIYMVDLIRFIGSGGGDHALGGRMAFNYFLAQGAIAVEDGYRVRVLDHTKLVAANLRFAEEVTLLQGENNKANIDTFKKKYSEANSDIINRISAAYKAQNMPRGKRIIMKQD